MPVSHVPVASLLLIAGTIAGVVLATAAPNIPPGEAPGRERERFVPSPIDRFTGPFASPRQAEPLYRKCDEKPPRRTKRKQGKLAQEC
jgi:hypothetical protein